MTTRRRTKLAASRRRSPWMKWLPWVISGLVILAVLWWGGLSYLRLKERVQPLAKVPNSHGFMEENTTQRQMLLLIEPGQAQDQIKDLAVIQVDFKRSKYTVVKLPVDLSNGEVAAGTFWRAGYYKELQQMAEQQLGIPLSGYLVDESQGEGASWSSVLTLEEPIGWLQSTIGLPQWLGEFGQVKTNLEWSKFLKMVWMARDTMARQGEAKQLPPQAIIKLDGWWVVDPAAADSSIREWLADPDIAQSKTTVVVENATSASGLAAQAGRLVANMGGEVVATVPADSPETRSQLIAAEESAMTTALSQYFGIPVTLKAKTGRERSDVELVLGSDALGRLGR